MRIVTHSCAADMNNNNSITSSRIIKGKANIKGDDVSNVCCSLNIEVE